MRVSSGDLRGRTFDSPKGNKTHPMSERIKTAMFNSLKSRIELKGIRILDAYSGSGALAFESVSRGADFAWAIEKDKNAHQAILANIQKLNIGDKVKATRANVATWSDNNLDEKFDLILVDPPFDNLNLSTIEKLGRHLKANGLMVLSHIGRETTPTVNGVVVVDNRIYGNAALSYYRNSLQT